MTSEIEKSLFRLAVFASTHSQRFGLSRYTLEPLANEQVIDIGRDILHLFEERYEEEMKKAPPAKPETPFGSSGAARGRKRLRGRDQ